MICPLCQTPQPPQTAFCTTCGNALATPRVPDAPASAMPGLETNDLLGAGSSVAAAPLEGLEPTSFEDAPERPVTRMAELETSDPDGGPAPIAPLEGLDDGRWVDPDPPSVFDPASVTCRYCKNVQAAGLFCERCGMRLPRGTPAASEEVAAPVDEEIRVLCRGCAARVAPGAVCRNCGLTASPATD